MCKDKTPELHVIYNDNFVTLSCGSSWLIGWLGPQSGHRTSPPGPSIFTSGIRHWDVPNRTLCSTGMCTLWRLKETVSRAFSIHVFSLNETFLGPWLTYRYVSKVFSNLASISRRNSHTTFEYLTQRCHWHADNTFSHFWDLTAPLSPRSQANSVASKWK